MPETDILIVGAGVLGLCTAVELTRRGHGVRVVDPCGVNASSVAAGMISPAIEAVLDRATPERAVLMRDARTRWDDFARASGITVHAARSVWSGLQSDAMIRALQALGFEAGPTPSGDGVSVPEEALIEPGPALDALRSWLTDAVIAGEAKAITRTSAGWRVATTQGEIQARKVILATGAAPAIEGLPVEVRDLIEQVSPIRGQIGFAEMASDRVVRGLGIYVVPSGAGALIGATMEPGRRDLEPDAAAGRQLIEAAEQLLGRPVVGPVKWRVGIRGATPDGLPMAGPSGEAGLFLALAPRRNGWLLGPLVARVVADAVESEAGNGGAGSPHAAALDPRRFSIR